MCDTQKDQGSAETPSKVATFGLTTVELTPLGFKLAGRSLGRAEGGIWASRYRAQMAADCLNAHGCLASHLLPDRYWEAV